ncbi:MAG TPA: YbaB/EbfC family nucleoid-associated protein [Amoebophilaceae bacterium]|jgi:DNA-binding YbaB/EbfC family protein|nr:YbaB/EbfC family nucleoid-associated protein [Amoebophilaceae bacterium]
MELFEQFGQIQEKIKDLQRQLAQLNVTKETGAGLVKATVNGNKQLLSISIDEVLLHPKDRVMLQDLIVAAVNAALEEVDQHTQEAIQKNAINL